jgi:hypothetical protein
LPGTEEVKMPKTVSEMEKIGIIADTLARIAREGATVEIGSRAYEVVLVRGPAGGERQIVVIGPYLEAPPRAISAEVLRAYRYYGHTKMYPYDLADSYEFKIFYKYLPEILRGFGVTKEELIRELGHQRGRFGAQLLK